MDNRCLYKAKRTDNGEWVKGDLLHGNSGICYICSQYTEMDDFVQAHAVEVDPSTICLYSGKKYMNCEMAFEGDIFESEVDGSIMILRYGTFQAYCPVDNAYMDSVGFYAECKGYPDMPIGDLREYALKKGNIFDNPELLVVK